MKLGEKKILKEKTMKKSSITIILSRNQNSSFNGTKKKQ